MTKIDVTPKLRTSNVTITSDALVFDFDNAKIVDGIADAMARSIADDLRAQPGDKWNRSGHLASGIRADGGDVKAPSDRLTRDPALAEKFRGDIATMRAPLDGAKARTSVEQATADIIDTKGTR